MFETKLDICLFNLFLMSYIKHTVEKFLKRYSTVCFDGTY